MIKNIHSDQAPKAIGPYSQAVEAGPFIFTSGQIPLDPQTGTLKGVDICEQTTQVFENLSHVLKACNLGFSDVVKTTVYLTTMNHFSDLNKVYEKYMGQAKPSRSTIAVAGLPRGALVEIDMVAYKG